MIQWISPAGSLTLDLSAVPASLSLVVGGVLVLWRLAVRRRAGA